MKKFNLKVFAPLVLILGASLSANAQQVQNEPARPAQAQQQQRPNLLQFLNLTPEQIQQIRLINQETRLQTRQANQRQRQARRALDEAIYADVPNLSEVELRTREFTESQAEAVRLRAQVEFRIRQVLTPEQLVRFRELRQRAGQNLLQRFQQRQQNKRP